MHSAWPSGVDMPLVIPQEKHVSNIAVDCDGDVSRTAVATRSFSDEGTLGIDSFRSSSSSDVYAAITRASSFKRRVRDRRHPYYKTELCRSWDETGYCRYGAHCQFAHGKDEIVHVPRHPKYKTVACRSFSAKGHCYYGTRCRFLHTSGTFVPTETTNFMKLSENGGYCIHRLPTFIKLSMGCSVENSPAEE